MPDYKHPSINPNTRRLLELLDRLRPQMANPAFRRLSELQLSPSHMAMLRILHADQPTAMKDLADRMQITPPSVTALTRRLVQTGMVERRPHPDDSRIALLALTDAGLALYQQLHAAHLERVGQLLAGLSAEEQAQFLDLFERAIAHAAPGEQEECRVQPSIRPATDDPDAA